MGRARPSQRFRERSGFQSASDRPGCSAAVSPLRRSACGGQVLDAGPFVPTGRRLYQCAGVFWRAAIARKENSGKILKFFLSRNL